MGACPVEVAREDGSISRDVAQLIDFADVDANDWLAVNQYTVIEGQRDRRSDVVLFVNGLPLAVVELKNHSDENATLGGSFNQLQTYKEQIPSLFRANAGTCDLGWAAAGALRLPDRSLRAVHAPDAPWTGPPSR